jgi:hypothetical protein
MHPLIWFLIVAPPCLAFSIWRVIGNKDFRAGIQPRTAALTLFSNRYGFWLILGVLYVGMFGTAMVLHKL